jgi:hypothetical protein
MYVGKMLFAQLMDFLPWKTFHRIVARYDGDARVRILSGLARKKWRAMVYNLTSGAHDDGTSYEEDYG